MLHVIEEGMERQNLTADPEEGFWIYSVTHKGYRYEQFIQRNLEGCYTTFVAREVVEVTDGEEVDEVEPLWYLTDGSYASLNEAMEVGNRVIQDDNPEQILRGE